MVLEYVEVVMELSSIGLVIAAAGLWAGGRIGMRPKNRDEPTLVGGTIWSQIIIPIGLMISNIVQENIDLFVKGYYLTTGILLLWTTGVVLIKHETKRYKRAIRRLRTMPPLGDNSSPQTQKTPPSKDVYDKVYYAIGVICILAGALKISEFLMYLLQYSRGLTCVQGILSGDRDKLKMTFGFIIITGLLAFGVYWTTKYLMSMPRLHGTTSMISTSNTSIH